MAGPGIVVDETFSCRGLGLVDASLRLRAAAGSAYRVVTLGADRMQLVRGVRPRWALVLGIVLAPTVVGLLFLLVRRPESFTASFEEDHRDARVRIEGTVSTSALRAVRTAFAPPPAPVLAGTPPAILAEGRPPFPPPAPLAGSPSTPPPPAPIGVLLRFDDGGVITAGPAMFIGRDPIAPPGEAPAMLVPVADPDRSVSKTHLTVRAHPDGVVVTDRGSVNGTAVETAAGVVRALTPGEAVLVPLGATVRFGKRAFVVSGGVV